MKIRIVLTDANSQQVWVVATEATVEVRKWPAWKRDPTLLAHQDERDHLLADRVADATASERVGSHSSIRARQ